MAKRTVSKPPKGLGATGRALWRSVQAGVADEYELDERETAILRLACEQADDAAALAEALRTSGVVVEGSKGQPRLSAIPAELRQSRLAVARLLGELELPAGEAAKPLTAAGQRAQRAAQSRWATHAARRAAHG